MYRFHVGIGEKQSAHKSRICDNFAVLRLELDRQPTTETRLQTLLKQQSEEGKAEGLSRIFKVTIYSKNHSSSFGALSRGVHPITLSNGIHLTPLIGTAKGRSCLHLAEGEYSNVRPDRQVNLTEYCFPLFGMLTCTDSANRTLEPRAYVEHQKYVQRALEQW